ncbi:MULTISPECIES: sensor domain-containing diguanylate cyclase [Bacillales]|uniref:sensor domain-containing diguanylate cyclase n=1 Tax=Bacillales TaxID=1385 RepID=UPI001E529114|nr:sensor domain-containing diguanylate cyclase [Metabacillus sp. B2-18]UGB30978.1 sensor domain-containing diguanylate cyclase [Metabacillus sp. B2-18]
MINLSHVQTFSTVLNDILEIAQELVGDYSFYMSFMDGEQTKIIQTLFLKEDVLTESCLYKTDDTFCQLISLNQKPVLIHDSLTETQFGILTLNISHAYKMDIRSYAGVPIYHKDGSILGAICSLSHNVKAFSEKTITVLEKVSSFLSYAIELELSNIKDSLTGLYNRVLWNRLVSNPTLVTEPFTFLMFDIDHFKQVNDRLGHHIGDEVLKGLGEMILRYIPKDAYGFRFGGDEFGVLLNSPYKQECEVCANNLLNAFEKMAAEILPDLSLSIGLVHSHQMKMHELLEGADKLLYQSKRTGGAKITKVQ